MAKDSYEISLWDDIFVAASGNVPGHYEEEKIAIIGSDTMTSECRAIEPKLVCNINGKVTFTFKMFYKYHDKLTGEDYENPFLKMLVNERKVKVKWLGRWYDLVIKNIQEASNGKTVSYSCEDANINELAKSGFELIFDDDLTLNNAGGSNQGTAQELVQRTIAGTDWILGDCDTIKQYTEEAVYEVTINNNQLTGAHNMLTNTYINIPSGQKILIFYPQLADFINNASDGDSIQIKPFYFAYDPEQRYDRLARTEMLVQADCYNLATKAQLVLNGSTITFNVTGWPSIDSTFDINDISMQYRANRLVSEPIIQIEPITGKSCYVYTATANGTGAYAGKVSTGDIIYESIGSEFGDALYATNLIVNGSSFTSLTGWESPTNHPIALDVYPTTAASAGSRAVSLSLSANTSGSSIYYYNDAIRANSQYFKDGCKQGEQYIFRIKAKKPSDRSWYTNSTLKLAPIVKQWTSDLTLGCKQPTGTTYFSIGTATYSSSDNWITFPLTCTQTFSGSDIYKDRIGLFINQLSTDSAGTLISEVEFFRVVKDGSNTIIYPGQLNKTGIINTTYTYFKISGNDVVYLYNGFEDWDKTGVTLTQKYNDNYSKVRSINIKQSNRFNILQTIAETFECWIRFDVEHTDIGKLVYVNGAPQKKIIIKQDMGEDRGIGFVYGIDLQSIQRTLESTQIVTKTIVLENNNEFGKDGTCRISRSKFNYPQVDYIYNFDYYVNHGLLDGHELNNDLYTRDGDATNTQGFYSKLHQWNSEYIKCAEENANYAIVVNKDEGLKTVYETAIDAATAQIAELKNWIVNVAATTTYAEAQSYVESNIGTNTELKAKIAAIEAQTQLITYYRSQLANLETAITSYNTKIATNQATMDSLSESIKAKTTLFQKKYARFISEGSWTDQKYYDDNLYYLDANSVAYTSSRPKVSYTISVIRLTGLKDFKIKDFSLGDISYIEDKEFFGYTYINDVKTPYREKVVITEITYNFDEPSKDTFQVQNYRTQFEDLFQRIAASTQALQYSVGAYNKVSDIIKSDGTIKEGVLQSSVEANNNALNRSSLNNAVITDERGITVTNIQNASEAVRVTAGGLFITTDGGDNWNNAIRGDGIGTQFLASGAIDTKKIQIIGESLGNEEAVAFKWDEDGINAYDSFSMNLSPGQAYDKNRYVRFNKEGISIQTTTSSGTAYEKLKLGRLNSDNEYGLRINALDSGNNIITALSASDTGLYVRGNIYAEGLQLGPSAESAIFAVTESQISSAVSTVIGAIPDVNLLPSIYAYEYSKGISFENQGITWTINNDGSITANGTTSTNSSWFVIAGVTSDAVVPTIKLDPNRDYVLSGCPAGGSLSKYSLQASIWYAGSSPSDTGTPTYYSDIGNSVVIPSGENYGWANIYAVIRPSTTVSNITFYPMFEFGTAPHYYVSTHGGTRALSTQIIQTADSISSTASAVETLAGRVSSAETSIIQSAGAISLAASRISGLEGNAQNILRNSGTFDNWAKSDGCTIGLSNTGYNYIGFPSVSTVSWRACYPNSSIRIPYASVRNRLIIVSVYAYSADASSIDGTADNRISICLRLYKHGTNTSTKYKVFADISKNSSPSLPSAGYTRFSWKLNLTDDWFTSGDGTVSPSDDLCLQLYNHSPYRCNFQRPQIEIVGTDVNAPSEYGPNPLDVSLSNAEASISINAEAITSKVESTDYNGQTIISKVNQTSSSYTIDAKNINLNGVVTANNYFKINTDGSMVATAGTIAGWSIGSNEIGKSVNQVDSNDANHIIQHRALMATISTWVNNQVAFSVRSRESTDNGSNWTSWGNQFYVTYDGHLFANDADISGKITATSGTIGGWTINSRNITKSTTITAGASGTQYGTVINANADSDGNYAFQVRERSYDATGSSTSYGGWASNFYVAYNGTLYAKKAYITGSITATSLTLSGDAYVAAAKVSGTLSAATIDASKITSGVINAARISSDFLKTANLNTAIGNITELSTKNIRISGDYGLILAGSKIDLEDGYVETYNVGTTYSVKRNVRWYQLPSSMTTVTALRSALEGKILLIGT